jgi:hypothetical protein
VRRRPPDAEVEAALDPHESSGLVERKVSILNADPDVLDKHEVRAVAMVNGSPERSTFMIFGQDEHGNIAGEVGPDGAPIPAEAVKQSQRRLEQRLQLCKPPLVIQWRSVDRGSRRVWVAVLRGRRRGTVHQTTVGSFPYRSGEDTHYADAAAIATWTAEVVTSEPLKIELRPAIPVYEGRGAGPNTWLSMTTTTHDRHGFKIVNIWFEMSNGMKLVALQPMPGSSWLPFLVTDHDGLQLLYEVAPLVEAVRDLRRQSGKQIMFARLVLEDSANRRHEQFAAMPILDQLSTSEAERDLITPAVS